MTMRIAVIGAGLSGLICAQELTRAGLSPVVLDKGRGIGGRLTTRRAGGTFQFDHGAQYLKAKSPEFAAFLKERAEAGVLAEWSDAGGDARFVGVPCMRSLAQSLLDGFDVRSSVEVSGLRTGQTSIVVMVSGEHLSFDHVILTIPAPQVVRLIGSDHPLSSPISAVKMAPNLTLMAGFASNDPGPFVTRRDPEADLAWIARDSSKPRRGDHACWVAQAGFDWSIANLENAKEDIAAKMLPLLGAAIGQQKDDVAYVAGHRWRYAHASKPLGEPYLTDDTGRLHIGGDWCLGARAEHAWQSGRALAESLLAKL